MEVKIAIQYRNEDYTLGWIDYCEKNNIPYKLVNCYDSEIIEELKDYDALMWHFNQESPQDIIFAKQLIYSLEMSGKIVFPDFRTCWHFDDKLGQKYLFESIKAPLVATHVFYSKKDAIDWIRVTDFPRVFKLRGGSGSINVRLVRTRKQAMRLARKTFGRGFNLFNSRFALKDRWIKYRQGKETFFGVIKGIMRLVFPLRYSYIAGKERGYIYFQDFAPDNTHDIRLVYVNKKCFGLRRKVRDNDFRASGSDIYDHDPMHIPQDAIKTVFDVADKLKLQTAAFDFVMHQGKPMIVEISYASGPAPEYFDHGYWDSDMNYYPGKFNPFGWMVEFVVEKVSAKRVNKKN